MAKKEIPQDFILFDSNVYKSTVEEMLFAYAEIAGQVGYKDVYMVYPRGLLAERENAALDESIIEPRRRTSPHARTTSAESPRTLEKFRKHVLIPDFNEADIDFLDGLANAFRKHLPPDTLPPDVVARVQHIAAHMRKELEPLAPAVPENQINVYNYDDQVVVAALYSVSGARKYIQPHIRSLKFNSADFSMLAWYEDSLSTILNKGADLSNRLTIFVSHDRGAVDAMENATREHGNDENYLQLSRNELLEYLAHEMRNVQKHIADNGIKLSNTENKRIAGIIEVADDLRAHRHPERKWRRQEEDKNPPPGGGQGNGVAM